MAGAEVEVLPGKTRPSRLRVAVGAVSRFPVAFQTVSIRAAVVVSMP